MDISEVKVGDTVVLNSGGPIMKITGIKILVEWPGSANGTIYCREFPVECLTAAESNNGHS